MHDVVFDFLSPSDFWKLALPLFSAIIAWLANERSKRASDQYQRKEANYKELLRSLRGFYHDTNNSDDMATEFLNQLNIAWLYCPDDVIKSGRAFLDTMRADHKKPSNTERQRALSSFVLAIRRDLLSRKLVRKTELSPEDFAHIIIDKRKHDV